jgi:ribosomal protein S14
MSNRRKTPAERAVSKVKKCRACGRKEETRKGDLVLCRHCHTYKRREEAGRG